MVHLVILGLLCCTTAEVVPSVRREKAKSKVERNVMAIKSSGLFENVLPQKSHMRRVKAHSSAFVDSSGGVGSSVQLITKGEDLADTRGPVSEALYNAKMEIANQIVEHKKALSDTNLALTRAEEDKAQKVAALAEAVREYNYYMQRHEALQIEITNVTKTISTLTDLSVSQQSEIDHLTAAHDAKHNATKTAEDLEALVVSLTGQLAGKAELKKQTQAQHAQALQEKTTSCDAAIAQLDDSIANLTSRIDDTQAQYDLLTELHTALSCSEKQAKDERICKKCTDGEPCGDICITADQPCHHDPGCACKADAAADATADATSESFFEDMPSAHPLQKTLQDAKAALRGIIAQHQDTMDSLSGSIVANEAQQAEMEKQKNRAIADFEASLKALSDEKSQLEASHKVSQTHKLKAEEDLRKAILHGTAGLDQLAQELKVSIAQLTLERTQTEKARTTRVTTCEEERKAMLDSQGATISALDAEVSQLEQQKSDAQQDLDVLKEQHGVADGGVDAGGADDGGAGAGSAVMPAKPDFGDPPKPEGSKGNVGCMGSHSPHPYNPPKECPCANQLCIKMSHCLQSHYDHSAPDAQQACDNVKLNNQDAEKSDQKCCLRVLQPCRSWQPDCFFNMTKASFSVTTVGIAPLNFQGIEIIKRAQSTEALTNGSQTKSDLIRTDSQGNAGSASMIAHGLGKRFSKSIANEARLDATVDSSLEAKCHD